MDFKELLDSYWFKVGLSLNNTPSIFNPNYFTPASPGYTVGENILGEYTEGYRQLIKKETVRDDGTTLTTYAGLYGGSGADMPSGPNGEIGGPGRGSYNWHGERLEPYINSDLVYSIIDTPDYVKEYIRNNRTETYLFGEYKFDDESFLLYQQYLSYSYVVAILKYGDGIIKQIHIGEPFTIPPNSELTFVYDTDSNEYTGIEPKKTLIGTILAGNNKYGEYRDINQKTITIEFKYSSLNSPFTYTDKNGYTKLKTPEFIFTHTTYERLIGYMDNGFIGYPRFSANTVEPDEYSPLIAKSNGGGYNYDSNWRSEPIVLRQIDYNNEYFRNDYTYLGNVILSYVENDELITKKLVYYDEQAYPLEIEENDFDGFNYLSTFYGLYLVQFYQDISNIAAYVRGIDKVKLNRELIESIPHEEILYSTQDLKKYKTYVDGKMISKISSKEFEGYDEIVEYPSYNSYFETKPGDGGYNPSKISLIKPNGFTEKHYVKYLKNGDYFITFESLSNNTHGNVIFEGDVINNELITKTVYEAYITTQTEKYDYLHKIHKLRLLSPEILIAIPGTPSGFIVESLNALTGEKVYYMYKPKLNYKRPSETESGKPEIETEPIDVTDGVKPPKEPEIDPETGEEIPQEEEPTSGGKNVEAEVDLGFVLDEEKLGDKELEKFPEDHELAGEEYIELEVEVEVTDSNGNKKKVRKKILYVAPKGKYNKQKIGFNLGDLLKDGVLVDMREIKIIVIIDDEDLEGSIIIGEGDLTVELIDTINPIEQIEKENNPPKRDGLFDIFKTVKTKSSVDITNNAKASITVLVEKVVSKVREVF